MWERPPITQMIVDDSKRVPALVSRTFYGRCQRFLGCPRLELIWYTWKVMNAASLPLHFFVSCIPREVAIVKLSDTPLRVFHTGLDNPCRPVLWKALLIISHFFRLNYDVEGVYQLQNLLHMQHNYHQERIAQIPRRVLQETPQTFSMQGDLTRQSTLIIKGARTFANITVLVYQHAFQVRALPGKWRTFQLWMKFFVLKRFDVQEHMPVQFLPIDLSRGPPLLQVEEKDEQDWLVIRWVLSARWWIDWQDRSFEPKGRDHQRTHAKELYMRLAFMHHVLSIVAYWMFSGLCHSINKFCRGSMRLYEFGVYENEFGILLSCKSSIHSSAFVIESES